LEDIKEKQKRFVVAIAKMVWMKIVIEGGRGVGEREGGYGGKY